MVIDFHAVSSLASQAIYIIGTANDMDVADIQSALLECQDSPAWASMALRHIGSQWAGYKDDVASLLYQAADILHRPRG